jgi:transposase
LGVAEQTLHNWIKAHTQGQLKEAGCAVGIEQVEISRLRNELACVKMERDIPKNAAAYFARESMCSTPSSNAIRPAGRYRCRAGCWA